MLMADNTADATSSVGVLLSGCALVARHDSPKKRRLITMTESFLVACRYLFSVVFGFILAPCLRRSKRQREKKRLEDDLRKARCFEEWNDVAQAIDALTGCEGWRQDTSDDLFDAKFIRHRLDELRSAKSPDDIVEWTQSGLFRDVGGVSNPLLYRKCLTGTKTLVQEYQDEICSRLRTLCEDDYEGFGVNDKLQFFREARHTYGRSALLLSGGAYFGLYHIGVVKALAEQNLLPPVICGTNVGALVASLAAVYTNEEIVNRLNNKSIKWNAWKGRSGGYFEQASRRLIRAVSKGVLLDIKVLGDFCRDNLGDLTFREAFKLTNRALNITVAPAGENGHALVLNHLTTPDVLLSSACTAACAFMVLYEPVELLAKGTDGSVHPYHPPSAGLKWRDATFYNDVPMQRLSELFNVSHFIVSQANPHVIPFMTDPVKNGWCARILAACKGICTAEIKHRLAQAHDWGIFPSVVNRIHSIVSQRYVGNITVIPPIRGGDYLRVVSCPNAEDIQRCTRVGEYMTWEKMYIIQDSLKTEMVLDECISCLKGQDSSGSRSTSFNCPIYPVPPSSPSFQNRSKRSAFRSVSTQGR